MISPATKGSPFSLVPEGISIPGPTWQSLRLQFFPSIAPYPMIVFCKEHCSPMVTPSMMTTLFRRHLSPSVTDLPTVEDFMLILEPRSHPSSVSVWNLPFRFEPFGIRTSASSSDPQLATASLQAKRYAGTVLARSVVFAGRTTAKTEYGSLSMAALESRDDVACLFEFSLSSFPLDTMDSTEPLLLLGAIFSAPVVLVAAGSSESFSLSPSPSPLRFVVSSDANADLPKVACFPRYCLDIKRGTKSAWMEEKFLVLATINCRTHGAKEYTWTSLHSVRITSCSPPSRPRSLDLGITSFGVAPVPSSVSTSILSFFTTIRGREVLLVFNHDEVDDRFWGNDKPMYSMSSLSRDRPPFLALADSLRGSPCSSCSRKSTNIAVHAISLEAGRINASRNFVFFFKITRSPGKTTTRVSGWINFVSSIVRRASMDPSQSSDDNLTRCIRCPRFNSDLSSQHGVVLASLLVVVDVDVDVDVNVNKDGDERDIALEKKFAN
mmetsp:Transcript_10297/g.20309  ORF Transcript_10297/g.20309 Transcript_10297/m.20309 type:complete len:495 (+) Transcript_10297:206-1690(+)